MAPNCIRCGDSRLPPDSGVPKNHSLNHCYRKWTLDKNGLILWPNFNNVGKAQDDAGDYQACERLLTQFNYLSDDKDKGKERRIGSVTKYMMEKAFRKVYKSDGSKNEPPAASQTNQRGVAQGLPMHPRGNFGNRSHQSGYPLQRGRGAPASYAPAPRGYNASIRGRPHGTNTGFYQGSVNNSPQPDKLATKEKLATCESDVYGRAKIQQLEGIRSNLEPPGSRLRVVTNHIALNSVPCEVYRYNINFGPMYAEDSPTRMTTVVQKSVKSLAFKAFCQTKSFNNKPYGTDFATFWCLEKLRDDDCSAQEIGFAKLSGRRFVVTQIWLEFDDRIVLHKFKDYDPRGNVDATRNLVKSLPVSMNDQSALRIAAFNALFSHYAHHRHTANSANSTPATFDPHAVTEIINDGPNKIFLAGGYGETPIDADWLIMLRGYFTSIRPGQDRPLLNINTATAAFFRPMKLSKIYSLIQASGRDYPPPGRLLRGLRVSIAYTRKKHGLNDPNLPANRHRVITEFGKTPGNQVFVKDGTHITVKAYFEGMGLQVLEVDLPCANVGAKLSSTNADDASTAQNQTQPQVWIPLEFLNLDQGQRFPKVLQGKHSEMMIQAAVRRPAQNQCLIVEEGFRFLGIENSTSIQEKAGLQLGSSLLSIPATMLAPPHLLYGKDFNLRPSDGNWNLMNRHFLNTSHGAQKLVRALDLCSPQFLYESPEEVDFMGGLNGTFKGHRMNCYSGTDIVSRLKIPHSNDDSTLEKAMQTKAKDILQTSLLIVFMPGRSKQLYGRIKRVCDQIVGIPTVCVSELQFRNDSGSWKYRGNSFAGPNPQLYSNLAMKINLKLEGQNHCVVRPPANNNFQTSAFSDIEKNTIVLGADVTHVSYGGRSNIPSIAAVVGSYGGRFIDFRGAVRLQSSRREMISLLQEMVLEHLTTYYTMHRKLPARIIFYRDGIGEDQFAACLGEEVPAIRRGFESAKTLSTSLASSTVTICFIVAGKRHNTRFYAANDDKRFTMPGQQKNNRFFPNGNLRPGLLVNNVITRPDVKDGIYDFFLQSHAAIQGTARSAHYTVLSDGGLKPQQIVDLTHAFCYNYQRATKAVSYPAPAYYADRLCARASLYLEGTIEKIAGGTEAEKTQLNKTTEEMNLPKNEAQSQMAERLVDLLSRRWVAPNRQNPWHPRLDKIMFWL